MSDYGDYVGGGRSYTLPSVQAVNADSAATRVQLQLTDTSSNGFVVLIAAPTGQTLTTTSPVTYPAQSSPEPGYAGRNALNLGLGRGCATHISGTLTVHTYRFTSSTSVVRSFAAEFVLHCTGSTAALHGRISLNSSVTMPALPTPILGPPPVVTVTPSTSWGFAPTPVGGASTRHTFTLTNNGPGSDRISAFTFGGADPDDFVGADNCGTVGTPPGTLPPGSSCEVAVTFLPGTAGTRAATLTVRDDESPPLAITLQGTGTEGYYEAGASGVVYPFGNAQGLGDKSGRQRNAPIVSMALTPTGGGYWLLGADGGIFNFGPAQFYGSTGGMTLNKPIVGMAATPDGKGCWLVAADGGIVAFGDAPYYGSEGGTGVSTVVAMASSSTVTLQSLADVPARRARARDRITPSGWSTIDTG